MCNSVPTICTSVPTMCTNVLVYHQYMYQCTNMCHPQNLADWLICLHCAFLEECVSPKLVSGVTHHGGCFTEAEGLKVGEIWQKQTRITCKCHKGGTQALILRQYWKIVKCFRRLEQLAFEFCMVHFPIDQFTRQSVEIAVNTKLSKFSTPCDMFSSY